MGFATAMHTGGIYPDRLAALLPLLDWVGLDIKGPLHHYDAITGTPGSGAKAWESLRHWVVQDCRAPSADVWALAPEKAAHLAERCAPFALRRAQRQG